MAFQRLRLPLVILSVVLIIYTFPGGSNGNKLWKTINKREVAEAKLAVAVEPDKAKEFLKAPKRSKRQLWDRTQPDVQQWIQQFMYMGFDELRFETDLSYWMDRGRNPHDYYGHQHHYDENAPIGPRDPYSYRHGASVNYDDY
ncbi:augurin-like isoform X1 [Acipenser oxyrinchus oxyrinchus]|uniref:Augurin-like isoform X1 n=1 Tax=Acipenser oxyrinchus oxyrinchus TaxID=40147 RepID=A0AAD8DFQ7_ACIOX|nr:augurin-like isoform X1 [Acipenser oxyrinchus oxyrinchus]